MGATRLYCMIALILAGAAFLTLAMGYIGLPRHLAEWIVSLGLSPFALIVALTAFYILLGCFLDGISMVVLTIGVILPTVEKAGIDLLWFGVFIVLVVEMAQITPPVGFNLFVLQGMTNQQITWIARHTVPMFLLMVVAVLLDLVLPGDRNVPSAANENGMTAPRWPAAVLPRAVGNQLFRTAHLTVLGAGGRAGRSRGSAICSTTNAPDAHDTVPAKLADDPSGILADPEYRLAVRLVPRARRSSSASREALGAIARASRGTFRRGGADGAQRLAVGQACGANRIAPRHSLPWRRRGHGLDRRVHRHYQNISRRPAPWAGTARQQRKPDRDQALAAAARGLSFQSLIGVRP